jgi:alpha-glucosidase
VEARRLKQSENLISDPHWWQKAVIYQIYPRSFQDSDGDGVGDLKGILQRVEYLSWLGVGAVWISPIYPSPMADFGYDVADYVGIDPLFGTLEDFDRLVRALHARGIRLILDLVPNHTSDRHPWFLEARSSRQSCRRDWYIWRDPAPDGGPPNNWVSQAGGSAWTLDPATGQYYYHAFLAEQPDLNWRNRAVRQAIYDVLRFWLARGVDGFRVDVLWHMIKDAEFRDDPLNPDYREGEPDFRRVRPLYSADRPEVLEIAVEMRRVLEEYPGDRLLIGEIYLPVERLAAYYGPDLSAVHLPFNFNLMWAKWQPAPILELVRQYEDALPAGAWPSWVLGNHDQMRIASRVGPAQARVAMVLLLTLRGTPTLYYGDELGLENVPIASAQVRDPFGLKMPGTGQGRDPERTPMPWDTSASCGFTTGEPWLPLGEGRADLSVAVQRNAPGSMLTLTRQLLELRGREPALATGEFEPLEVEGEALAYARTSGSRRFTVILNLEPRPKAIRWRDDLGGRVALSTHPERTGRPVADQIELAADEAVVIAPDQKNVRIASVTV